MSEMHRQSFAIKGMSCAACQARIEKAVAAVPGVQSVSVQLLQNTMAVSFEGGSCSDELICNAVKEAGYEAHALSSGAHGRAGRAGDGTSLSAAGETEARNVARRQFSLIASAVLTVVLMIVSMGPMTGISIISDALVSAWVQLAISLAVMVLNYHYFTSGFKAMLGFAPNMDSLVSVGAGASFLFSCYSLYLIPPGFDAAHLHDHYSLYFESVATILTLVSVGKYFEAKARHKAVSAIAALYELAPDTAVKRVADGRGGFEETTVPLDDIVPGDEIILRNGDRVGVDCVVIEGSGVFDESALTGEARPVTRKVGSPVTSATFMRDGYVVCRVLKTGADTTLSKIIALVDEANSQKAPISRIADRISFFFVPAVMLISLVTAIIWIMEGAPPGTALTFAVSVLVVSCPCALGLAAPTAIMVATGRSASMGILFKSPEAIEQLSRVNIMVFDKTGTITASKMSVARADMHESSPLTRTQALQLVLAMEQRSEHPIARALATWCRDELVRESAPAATDDHLAMGTPGAVATAGAAATAGAGAGAGAASAGAAGAGAVSAAEMARLTGFGDGDIEYFKVHEGRGVEMKVRGHVYYMGSTEFMKGMHSSRADIAESRERLEEAYVAASEKSSEQKRLDQYLLVHLFDASQELAAFYLGDRVRQSAQKMVKMLHIQGVRPLMVSGDRFSTVEAVARRTGIDTWKAACMPADKAYLVNKLKGKENVVAMVGDGINDAPSLAASDVGISLAGGTDIAASCADIIVMRDDLTTIARAIALSKLTLGNIKENFFWAFVYNIFCIPLAAGLFVQFDMQLNPMVAALLMSMSSVCVVGNALRLRSMPLNALAGVSTKHCKAMACKECENYAVCGSQHGGDLAKQKNTAARLDLSLPARVAVTGGPLPAADAATGSQAAAAPASSTASGSSCCSAGHGCACSADDQSCTSTSASTSTSTSTSTCAASSEPDSESGSCCRESRGECGCKDSLQSTYAVHSGSLQAQAQAFEQQSEVSEFMEKTVQIEGMSCQHCVRSVTRALSALPGCEVIEVSLENKYARIKAAPELSDEQISSAITKEGFECKGIPL